MHSSYFLNVSNLVYQLVKQKPKVLLGNSVVWKCALKNVQNIIF